MLDLGVGMLVDMQHLDAEEKRCFPRNRSSRCTLRSFRVSGVGFRV
jgi:hypothetical protein